MKRARDDAPDDTPRVVVRGPTLLGLFKQFMAYAHPPAPRVRKKCMKQLERHVHVYGWRQCACGCVAPSPEEKMWGSSFLTTHGASHLFENISDFLDERDKPIREKKQIAEALLGLVTHCGDHGHLLHLFSADVVETMLAEIRASGTFDSEGIQEGLLRLHKEGY